MAHNSKTPLPLKNKNPIQHNDTKQMHSPTTQNGNEFFKNCWYGFPYSLMA
jgi:hypothetical protein